MTYKDIEEANKAIQTTTIQKKEYAEVNQRIKAFRMLYPDGFIKTELVSIEGGVCIMRAYAGYFDNTLNTDIILATGTAYEKEGSTFINKTSYIENCETSAVGRALGMLGIGIDASVASAEEVQNAQIQQKAMEKLNKTELSAVRKAIANNGYNEPKICEFFKIEKLEDMTVGQLRQFNEMIEKSKEKK
jgi:hypothetical protein